MSLKVREGDSIDSSSDAESEDSSAALKALIANEAATQHAEYPMVIVDPPSVRVQATAPITAPARAASEVSISAGATVCPTAGTSRLEAAKRALELNRELQSLCKAQLQGIMRGLERNERARRRARDAERAQEKLLNAAGLEKETVEYLEPRSRPSLRPSLRGEAPPLNADAAMRDRLAQQVPLKPAEGTASTPWNCKEREQLRKGVAVTLIGAENTRILTALQNRCASMDNLRIN